MTQLGCWNTYFVDPKANTLAHQFMLSPSPTGDGVNAPGAVGVLGASTLTEASAEREMGLHLFDHLFDW